MSLQDFTDYKLPKNAYLTFDADTLKSLIIERLNENETFTDQNFEGSNFSAFIDVVAYMYHVLLFQLNTTSNESTFNTATIYENMNKLVSNIGYKPLGDQTALLNFNLSAANIPTDVYTIPRFSSVVAGGISFVTIEDTTFQKTTNTTLEAVAPSNNTLYQGTVNETIFTATGEPYENITLVDSFTSPQLVKSVTNLDSATFISDNAFNIFVKNAVTGVWSEWYECASLFLESAESKSYEKRLNSSGNYEFKFGNNLNGKQLESDDTILIFYVISDNEAGIKGPNTLANAAFNLYGSTNFEAIKSVLYSEDQNLITSTEVANVTVNNNNSTLPPKKAETTDDIKTNAPKVFASQNRLVTKEDYEYQVNRNFNNITKDVKVLSNDEFTSRVLGYYTEQGLGQGNDDARMLFSQVQFSTSTSFNNVYIYTVPSGDPTLNSLSPKYLNAAQKQIIADFCNNKKDITHNVVVTDALFKAFAFGVSNTEIASFGDSDSVDEIVQDSRIRITVDKNQASNNGAIKSAASTILNNYFSKLQLGDVIDVAAMTNDILNIQGVTELHTINGDAEIPNLSFVVWNPDYKDSDRTIQSLNYQLEDFEYAYFYDIANITNKIAIRRL